MIGELVGLTLETEHGYVDLIAVAKALVGERTRLSRAERLYACQQYGTTEGNLRRMRWAKSSQQRGPLPPLERDYCGQVEPPGTRYSAQAAATRQHSGQWVLVAEHIGLERANNLAANIRRGQLTQFRPRGAYRSRTLDGSVWALYTPLEGR